MIPSAQVTLAHSVIFSWSCCSAFVLIVTAVQPSSGLLLLEAYVPEARDAALFLPPFVDVEGEVTHDAHYALRALAAAQPQPQPDQPDQPSSA